MTLRCLWLANPGASEEEEARQTWPEGVAWFTSPEAADVGEANWLLANTGDRRITLDLLAAMPNLAVIQGLNHGVNFLADPHITEHVAARGLTISRAPVAGPAVAEYAMMAMIALSRRVLPLHHALSAHGDWSTALLTRQAEGALGGELAGARLGIISLGAIGRHLAHRAHAFGMEVWGLTRSGRTPREVASCIHWVGCLEDVDQLLKACDYLVLCVPLTPQTRGLLNRRRLSLMPRGSILVNVARGEILEEAAVYEALVQGQLAGAALDVWSRESAHGREPGYPSAYPFHTQNVIMTPHYASWTREARLRAIALAGRNMHRWLAGQPLKETVVRDGVMPGCQE